MTSFMNGPKAHDQGFNVSFKVVHLRVHNFGKNNKVVDKDFRQENQKQRTQFFSRCVQTKYLGHS